MKILGHSIKNLRGIKENLHVRSAPITLVVGANSSGKSTYVRSLPLLRQSVETGTLGPILWFGELADYGSFHTSLCNSSDLSEIEFGFKIGVKTSRNKVYTDSFMYRYGVHDHLPCLSNFNINSKLIVTSVTDSDQTYAKELQINLLKVDIRLTFNQKHEILDIYLNEKKVKKKYQISLNTRNGLFSCGFTRIKDDGSSKIRWRRSRSYYVDEIVTHLSELFHGNTKKDSKVALGLNLGLGGIKELKEQIIEVCVKIGVNIQQGKKVFLDDEKYMNDLKKLVILSKLPMILMSLNELTSGYLAKIRYIRPLRATAERFYRRQDLSIDEVDPEGKNLAMFLMGHDMEQQNNFSNWCLENIGFAVEAKSEGAHVSLILTERESNTPYNIADMGFGFSQIIPVLATIWKAIQKNNSPVSPWEEADTDNIPETIIIEQPELHLHPAMQAKFADVMVNLMNTKGKSLIRFVCETHSETIVNRIGERISSNDLKNSDVQVLLFEKKKNVEETMVRKATYSEEGSLTNWPYDFFLPEAVNDLF